MLEEMFLEELKRLLKLFGLTSNWGGIYERFRIFLNSSETLQIYDDIYVKMF